MDEINKHNKRTSIAQSWLFNSDKWLKHGVDFLLPSYCPVTEEKISHAHILSANAWRKLRFIDEPCCIGCGAPFELFMGKGALCGACIVNPLGFDEVRAAIVYDETGHQLISKFKYGDRTDLAPLLSSWLYRVALALIEEGTIVLPVPLHKRRLFSRRYNQAGLLAQNLVAAIRKDINDVTFEPNFLVRQRMTSPQQSLSADARQRNVRGAFAIAEGRSAGIRGRNFLLVDDVLTTGATLKACARVLKLAGAREIKAAVLARVVKSGEDAI